MTTPWLRLLLGLGLALGIVAGCGDDDGEADSTSQTTAGPAVETTAPADADEAVVDDATADEPAPAGGGFPIAIENCDITWEYEAAPERAVVVDTVALEIMLELGLADAVVGFFGNPDNLKPENRELLETSGIEVLGSDFPPPSLEAILAPDPDFVSGYLENEEGGFTAERLASEGINAFFVPEVCPGFTGSMTIDTTFEIVRTHAAIFGIADRGEELIAGYEERLAAAAELVPAGAEPPSVFHKDFGDDTIFTAGGRATPTDIIARSGGANIFSDRDGGPDSGFVWLYVTKEEIVERDPDWMVVVDYGGTADDDVAALEADPALSVVQAVQEGRYVYLTYPQIVPGVQNVDAVEIVTAALWGEGG